MISTTLCYSAISGSSVADYDKPCRVDMGNVGSTFSKFYSFSQVILHSLERRPLNNRHTGEGRYPERRPLNLDGITFIPSVAPSCKFRKGLRKRESIPPTAPDLGSHFLGSDGKRKHYLAMRTP